MGIENGKIALMAARGITTTDLKAYFLHGEKGYLNGVAELNAICSMFGQGKGAVEASSIDFKKILKYGNGDTSVISKYMNIYTYRFPTSGSYMQYKSEKVNADNTRELLNDWTDITGEQSQTFRLPGTTTTMSKNNRSDIGIELQNTAYDTTVQRLLKNNEAVSSLLRANSSGFKYWLADEVINNTNVNYGGAGFGLGNIHTYWLQTYVLYNADGRESTSEGYHVVPVVTLKTNIEIEKNDTYDGSTLEKACIIK